MAKKHTKEGGSVVYRPLAVKERKLKQTVLYSNERSCPQTRDGITEVRYQHRWNHAWQIFDYVSYKNFFGEYAWDKVKTRNLHTDTRIRPGKFIPRKWLDSRRHPDIFQMRFIRSKALMDISFHLFDKMVEHMVKTGSRVMFNVKNKAGIIEGKYKIGVFIERRKTTFEERLILSIVPHEKERVGKFYPIVFHSKPTRAMLDEAYKQNYVTYEHIDVQERLAEDSRLSGVHRRVRKPTKNKKTHIQSGHRFKGGS